MMDDQSVVREPVIGERRYWNGPTGWLIGDALDKEDVVVDEEGVDWPTNDDLLRERLAAGSRASYQAHLVQLSEAVNRAIENHPEALQRIRDNEFDAADSIVAEVVKSMRGVAEVDRVRDLVLSLTMRPRAS